MKTLFGILTLAALCASLGAQAEVYRWVDKTGKVNYSDAPPADAPAEPRRLHDNRIDQEKLPYTTRKAAERFPLRLAVSADCKEPCVLARAYLNKRKLPFTEQTLATTADHDAFLLRTGKKEVILPTLLVGEKALAGFEETSWSAALEYAGYPK